MNLLPSEEQTQIQDAIRSFLQGEAPVDRLREFGAIGNPDARLWPELAGLGFIGLGIGEADGGAGLSSSEEALTFREYGRFLISPAIFGSTLGARIAARAGDTALRDSILQGAETVGLASPRGPAEIRNPLSGQFHLVEGDQADLFLVAGPDGAALVRRASFQDVSPVRSTDSSLSLSRASLADAAPLHWVSSREEPIHDRALLLLSAYAVGMAEATRDMAVEYAKVREQFGRPIGAFQAVKHKCAEMAMRSEAALCQMSFASIVFADAREDAPFHAVASKIVATDAALRNAQQNIQVHGAFGFTSEANAHHYLKRAHLADQLWGDARAQRERLLDMPSPL